ncbi:MAG: porin PorA family protein [Dehalococcoidia bacterium]
MLTARIATRLGVGAGILGLALIVFGSVWITAVFPIFEKIPSDWDQIDDLAGTYTDVDRAFLGQLLGNETIGQLQAAPEGQNPLEDPAVQAILSNPAVGLLVSDEGLLALVQDPQSMQALANPTLLSLLSNPEVLGLLQDPSFMAALAAALANPAALPQLVSDYPAVGPLLADPEVLALLQDPAVQALLQSGALVTLATQPQLLGLLGDPALGTVLANPAVQALLADQEALLLILDPRTPPLLANPAALPTISGEVVIHRVRRATGTDGNRIFINEQKTYTDPTTGQELPGFPMEDFDLIVDRKSKEYLPGTDEGRTGYWGLPFHVDKDKDPPYDSWITAAKQPYPAEYQSTEELQGLETYLFVQEVSDLPLGDDETTGLSLVVDALIKAWVEPETGSIVRIEDRDVVSAVDPTGQKHTWVVFDVKHTEETVTELVEEAKDNRNKIVWFGTNMPWLSMGLGIFLAVGGGALVGGVLLRRGEPGSAF